MEVVLWLNMFPYLLDTGKTLHNRISYDAFLTVCFAIDECVSMVYSSKAPSTCFPHLQSSTGDINVLNIVQVSLIQIAFP